MLYNIAASANDPFFAKAERLADLLARKFPDVTVVKHIQHPDAWKDFLAATTKALGFDFKGTHMVWSGTGRLIGHVDSFASLVHHRYGIALEDDFTLFNRIAEENMTAKLIEMTAERAQHSNTEIRGYLNDRSAKISLGEEILQHLFEQGGKTAAVAKTVRVELPRFSVLEKIITGHKKYWDEQDQLDKAKVAAREERRRARELARQKKKRQFDSDDEGASPQTTGRAGGGAGGGGTENGQPGQLQKQQSGFGAGGDKDGRRKGSDSASERDSNEDDENNRDDAGGDDDEEDEEDSGDGQSDADSDDDDEDSTEAQSDADSDEDSDDKPKRKTTRFGSRRKGAAAADDDDDDDDNTPKKGRKKNRDNDSDDSDAGKKGGNKKKTKKSSKGGAAGKKGQKGSPTKGGKKKSDGARKRGGGARNAGSGGDDDDDDDEDGKAKEPPAKRERRTHEMRTFALKFMAVLRSIDLTPITQVIPLVRNELDTPSLVSRTFRESWTELVNFSSVFSRCPPSLARAADQASRHFEASNYWMQRLLACHRELQALQQLCTEYEREDQQFREMEAARAEEEPVDDTTPPYVRLTDLQRLQRLFPAKILMERTTKLAADIGAALGQLGGLVTELSAARSAVDTQLAEIYAFREEGIDRSLLTRASS